MLKPHDSSLFIEMLKSKRGEYKLPEGVVMVSFGNRNQSPSKAPCDAELTEPCQGHKVRKMKVFISGYQIPAAHALCAISDIEIASHLYRSRL